MMHPEGFSTRANILESLFPRLQDSMKLEQGHATLPLRDADHVTFGKQIPWWQDWMEHAEPGDPFWNPIDYTAAVTRTLPAAMVGGWYDIFLPWLVKDFEAAHAAGRKVTQIGRAHV